MRIPLQIGVDLQLPSQTVAGSGRRRAWAAPGGRYNFFMMPRWLIAVLALYFSLSVGISASGKTHSISPLPGPSLTAAQCKLDPTRLTTLTMAAENRANEPAAAGVVEHGLADASQELPDDQDIRFLRPACGVAPVHYPNLMGPVLPSPLLKKLHKPPRGNHAQRG